MLGSKRSADSAIPGSGCKTSFSIRYEPRGIIPIRSTLGLGSAARSRIPASRLISATRSGFRADVLSLQKGFDLFAMSSVTEGLGTALLDAMAIGQAIVATRAGGIPEVVAHDQTGVLVPPRDADALAAAIVRLLGDPDRRAQLGAAGHERARTSFSVERMVQATLDAYGRLGDTPLAAGTDRPAVAG